MRGVLLLIQERVEHGFFDVNFVPAPAGIDERVWGALAEFRVLLPHIILSRMVTQRHVTRERAHEWKRAVELSNYVWCQHRRRPQAAPNEYVVRLSVFPCLHGPCRAAVSVTCRQVRCKTCAA